MRYWKDKDGDIYVTTNDMDYGCWLKDYKSEGRSGMIAIDYNDHSYLHNRVNYTELTGADLMLELL